MPLMLFGLRTWESLIFIGKIKDQVHLTLMSWLTGPVDIGFVFLTNSCMLTQLSAIAQ